jgi:hypothetical protein
MSDDLLDFTRPLAISDVSSGGRTIRITTDERERSEVARILSVRAVSSLEAELDVLPFGKEGLSVAGEIHAHLTQVCVVTSEDFDSDVVASVAIRFSPDGRNPNAAFDPAELADPEAEDPPDLLVGGRIDLADVVVEFLALALDPYPRKPGAVFSKVPGEKPESPFAALKRPETKQ